jgi:hypothetical protein
MVTDQSGRIVDYSDNPTLPLIESEIQTFQPDFIVIEAPEFIGAKVPHGESRQVAIAGVKYSDINEVARSAALAEQHGIPYQGGEPDEVKLQEEMKRRGYSTHDMMGLYAFRQIPTMNGDGKQAIDEQVLETRLNDFFKNHHSFQHIPMEERLDYQSFKGWFRYQSHGLNLNLATLNTNDAAPVRGESATYFQRAMADIGDIREENVNRIIQQAMDKYDRVMVVYGSGHLVKSLPVYQEAFGDPQLYEVQTQQPAAAPEIAPKGASGRSFMRSLAAAALGVAVGAAAVYLFAGMTMTLATAAAITVGAAGGGYVGSQLLKPKILSIEAKEIVATEAKPAITLQPRALAPELSQNRGQNIPYHQHHAQDYLRQRENTAATNHRSR